MSVIAGAAGAAGMVTKKSDDGYTEYIYVAQKREDELRRANEESKQKKKNESLSTATAWDLIGKSYEVEDGYFMKKFGLRPLTKEQAEQVTTGKIPPMPGDDLPVAEWMRLRNGGGPTPTEEEQRIMDAERERQVKAAILAKMAAQQNDTVRQQMAQGMQNVYGGYGAALGGIGQASSFPYLQMPKLTPDPPKKRTAKPDKTTEQAQEELTGIGKRKIIVDGENNP